MKAIEINRHFLSMAPWLDLATTVDRVIIGDPDRDVRSCLVTWISTFAACRIAVERKVDLLITHEPTFYDHRDKLPDQEPPAARAKHDFIEKSGLVIIRNHDVWDLFPEVGIPWAWARFLGLGAKPVAIGAAGYQHRYGIQLAEDMGHPVIRVNHGTSEEPGMRTMAQYINANLTGVQAEYLPHRPAYQLVGDRGTK